MRTSDGQQFAFAAQSGGRLTGGVVSDGDVADGDVADGTYCVWLTDRGRPEAVLWPPGYRARLDPLEILDQTGRVVAREGEMLAVGGGAVPVDPALPSSLGQSGAFYIQVIA